MNKRDCQRAFEYNSELDAKNILYRYPKKISSSISTKIDGGKEIIRILKKTQPSSIYDSTSQSLVYYPGRIVLLKRAIVIPDCYELFWAPWIADGSHSYASEFVRRDWKQWFSCAHLAKRIDHCTTENYINPDRFSQVKAMIDGKYKYIIRNHSDADNYWHWTFEWLPRMFLLKKALEEMQSNVSITLIAIGAPLNRFQKEWLTLCLGMSRNIEFHDGPLVCDNLFWACPTFPAHHCLDVLAEIKDTVISSNSYKKALATRQGFPRRIYLLRGNAKNGRRVTNEKALIEMLEGYGFVPMTMDALSVAEQAVLFGRAEFIIGPHGSAFVNMLFCGEDCRVIELFGPGYLSGHDYSLAHTCKVKWEWIEGEACTSNPCFYSDYFICPDQLRTRISSIVDVN